MTTTSPVERPKAPYECEVCHQTEQIGMPDRGSIYYHYSGATTEKAWTKKQAVCLPCGGKIAQTQTQHAFQATYALLAWVRIRQGFLYEHYRSIKLYEFTDGGRSPWAWAFVINGEYQDIREGHLRSSIQDGHVPRKIKVGELRAEAQREWKAGGKDSMARYAPQYVEDLEAAMATAEYDHLPDRDSSEH